MVIGLNETIERNSVLSQAGVCGKENIDFPKNYYVGGWIYCQFLTAFTANIILPYWIIIPNFSPTPTALEKFSN